MPNDWRAMKIVCGVVMTPFIWPMNSLTAVPSAMLYSHVPVVAVKTTKFPSGVNVHLLSDDRVVDTMLQEPVLILYLRNPNAVVDADLPAT
jgi:hypothetical protein